MEIREVSIEDVFPYEDEYGNQFLSRDYSTKANKEYVHRLAESMKRKGIPDELVELVEDGDIYRIKSGNSRVMAMKELGTKRFPAIVFNQEDLLESIETTIRTNVKKTYEPVEESRFVQQLAIFADDQYVSETTGMDVGKVKRIRKGAKAVDDAAQAMSLDRLMAIGEFEDDPDAVKKLTTCKESECAYIASNLRDAKAREELTRNIGSALEQRGIAIVTEAEGMRPSGYIYTIESIPEDIPEGTVATKISWGAGFQLYSPADEGIDEEAQRKAEAREAAEHLYSEGSSKRKAWLADQIIAGNPLAALKKIGEGYQDRFSYEVDDFLSQFDDDVSAKIASHIEVSTSDAVELFAGLNANGRYGIRNYFLEYDEENCRDYKTLIDAMEADGYEPSENEQKLYQEAVDFLEREVVGNGD